MDIFFADAYTVMYYSKVFAWDFLNRKQVLQTTFLFLRVTIHEKHWRVSIIWIYSSFWLVYLHKPMKDFKSIKYLLWNSEAVGEIHFLFRDNTWIFSSLKPHFCWTKCNLFLLSELCPFTLYSSFSHHFISLSLPISVLLASLGVNLFFILLTDACLYLLFLKL